jgi:hypothetical protein
VYDEHETAITNNDPRPPSHRDHRNTTIAYLASPYLPAHMARLNEPPIAPQPSAETIDAIKRRFLRQNRELAKTNSTQSIRIRSLENDCHRLLAENLALREQVLSLHNTIESRPAFDHIDAIKSQLEAKIQELGGLVSGLAQVKNQNKGRRKSHATAKRKSGDERQWRSGLGLQEVENGMLPTITEGKFYPRRTIGYVKTDRARYGVLGRTGLTTCSADELQQVLEDPDSHSPDIGPPPVSRFEDEDPIGFNPSPSAEEQREDPAEDGEPVLSVNLETRKKRRESGPKLNIRRVSVFESPEEPVEDAAKPLRAGAKRKFTVQEDEDSNQSKGDAFRFSRRNASSTSGTEASNEYSRPSSPERPVLSAKPVNTDPVLSPKKQRSSTYEKSDKPEKPEKPTSKARGRPRINITRHATSDLPPLPMPEPVLTADIVLESLPPKTPAVEDVFSPPSTEPSTQRPENKDTPPPGDLSASDRTGQAGRPGRRARPQVSYKEPSLNVKMRRPDAKLVDAVVDRRTSVETQAAPSTIVKRESNGDIAWKPVSAVSGRGGEDAAEVGSPLREKLDRRDQDSKISPATEPSQERSTSSKAITALIDETSTAKRKAAAAKSLSETVEAQHREQHAPMQDIIDVKQEIQEDKLAVFDFTDSSPADTVANSRARISELAKAARTARRHSAMPATSSSTTTTTTAADKEDRKAEREKAESVLSSLHKRTGSGSIKSSSTTSLARNPSANSLARSTSSARITAGVREKKASGGGSLPVSASTIDLRVKADGTAAEKDGEVRVRDRERERETSTLRAERAASRRKSMML